jgi:superkiller protein 3
MILSKFQLYFKASEKQLARQVFDRARSIDPGLALPWASMSAESYERYYSSVIYLDISCSM